MKNVRDTFGKPDKNGVVHDAFGRTGIANQHNGYVFLFRDEAEERYARLLAQSKFFRRPQFMSPAIDDGKLALVSSGRRVVVQPETWEGLKDAIVRLAFEYAPPKTLRVGPSGY